jgi:hypothetical protein
MMQRCIILLLFLCGAAQATTGEVFANIYKHKTWSEAGGGSGAGSTLGYTQGVRNILSTFILEHNIKTMADVPCGSFHWMEVFLQNHTEVEYYGIDVVDLGLAESHRHNARLHFYLGDISQDQLPQHVDLLFSRDALQHLPLSIIKLALQNIQAADPHYFLVGSYPKSTRNVDIAVGEYFAVDLKTEPFNLIPSAVFDENTPDGKHLYLYTRDQIRNWFKSSTPDVK